MSDVLEFSPGVQFDPESNRMTAMYMPAGVHTRDFRQNGKGVTVTVSVGPEAATRLQNQLEHLNRNLDKRAYFDFDHEDQKASAWPKRFFWQDRPHPGVYFEAELSASGRAAIEGKDFRCFSPVFHVENGTGTPNAPAKIISHPIASLNMGGFVNDPAFVDILPFWASNALAAKNPSSPNEHSNQNIMAKAQITELTADRKAVAAKLSFINKAELSLNPRFNPSYWKDKRDLAAERSSLYAREIAPRLDAFLDPALRAATAADSLGTLDSMLIQHTMEVASREPMFQRITTRPQDKPIQFNSASPFNIALRVASTAYDPEIDVATGRPKGWVITTPAQAHTAQITINKHSGSLLCFDQNTLAGTNRNLFEEQDGRAKLTLIEDIATELRALITPANFPSYNVDGAPPIKVAEIDFGRRNLLSAARLMAALPMNRRSVFLGMEATESLADSGSASFGRGGDDFTDNTFGKMHSFNPLEEPRLPTTNNLLAFAFHESALVLETGLPGEYWKFLPENLRDGAVSVVSATNGLSALVVCHVNHQGGWAAKYLSIAWGCGVGYAPAGVCIVKP